MCGIIGIISTENVLRDLFIGLTGLQHRGQDSAGLLSFDGHLMRCHKGAGLVDEVFKETDFFNHPANAGIGHTRYPTIGADLNLDAQPMFVDFPKKIGIAHNGNLTNYASLRNRFDENHASLSSSCDVEPILLVLAQQLMHHSSIESIHVFDAVQRVFDDCKGAYSVVALINGAGLLAFRDSHAIRPLLMAEKIENGVRSVAFASESVVLESAGFSIVRDLLPGEAVLVDPQLNIQSKIVESKMPSHCMFEWVYFARPESVMQGKDVYQVRLNLGRSLAKLWKQTGLEADVVIPVPDTSRSAGLTLAEELKIPYREGLIKNRYIGRTFIMNSQVKREHSVKLKLNVVKSEIVGKRVILVDDSIVRGTTSKQIVQLVRNAGASKVYFLSTCPPVSNACFYGIDMPNPQELIANSKTVQQIQDFIGADYLLYNTVPELQQSIGLQELCMACLNGKYVVPVPKEAQQQIEQERELERAKLHQTQLRVSR